MDRLGRVLPGVLAKQPGAERLAEIRVGMAVRAVLGELSAACVEIAVTGTTLRLTVTDPQLAGQLRAEAAGLLARVNEGSRTRPVRRLSVSLPLSRGAR